MTFIINPTTEDLLKIHEYIFGLQVEARLFKRDEPKKIQPSASPRAMSNPVISEEQSDQTPQWNVPERKRNVTRSKWIDSKGADPFPKAPYSVSDILIVGWSTYLLLEDGKILDNHTGKLITSEPLVNRLFSFGEGVYGVSAGRLFGFNDIRSLTWIGKQVVWSSRSGQGLIQSPPQGIEWISVSLKGDRLWIMNESFGQEFTFTEGKIVSGDKKPKEKRVMGIGSVYLRVSPLPLTKFEAGKMEKTFKWRIGILGPDNQVLASADESLDEIRVYGNGVIYRYK